MISKVTYSLKGWNYAYPGGPRYMSTLPNHFDTRHSFVCVAMVSRIKTSVEFVTAREPKLLRTQERECNSGMISIQDLLKVYIFPEEHGAHLDILIVWKFEFELQTMPCWIKIHCLQSDFPKKINRRNWGQQRQTVLWKAIHQLLFPALRCLGCWRTRPSPKMKFRETHH